MNSLCTKQPLCKGHLCIRAKTLFPKGVRYPLYCCTCYIYKLHSLVYIWLIKTDILTDVQTLHLIFTDGFFTEFPSQYLHSDVRVEFSQSLPTHLRTVLANISRSEEKLCVCVCGVVVVGGVVCVCVCGGGIALYRKSKVALCDAD